MIVARERATVACARGPQWHDEHYPGIVFYIMQDGLSMQSCRPFDTSGDGKCSNWASVNFLRKYQVAANSTPLVSTGLGC